MIINKLFIYFIIINIYLKLYSIQVNSYKIENVTPYDYYFKVYSPSHICPFSYLILCTETNQDDNCSYLMITFDKQTPLNLTGPILSSNSTSSLYRVGFTRGLGLFSIDINSVLQFTVECLELDLNIVDFKLTNPGFYYNMYGAFMGLVPSAKYDLVINNGSDSIKSGASLISFQTSNIDSLFYNTPFSQSFSLSFTDTLKTTRDLNSNIITLNNNLVPKQFNLGSIGKDTFDNIYDIQIYPDIEYLNNLELFGLGFGGLILFKSNNTAFKNSYVLNIDGISFNTQIGIAYGDENSTTYILSLKEFNKETLYEMFYISNSEFKKAISLNATIKQFPIVSYPNTNAANLDVYKNGLPITTISFSDNKIFQFHPLSIYLTSVNGGAQFPFGFKLGGKDGYNFSATLLLRPYYFNSGSQIIRIKSSFDPSSTEIGFSFSYQDHIVYNSSLIPEVLDYEFIPIVDEMYLLRINIKSPYGLNKIQHTQISKTYYANELLVSGDIFQGQYEIVLASLMSITLHIFDNYGYRTELKDQNFVSLNPTFKMFQSPSYIKNFNILSVYNVSFLYNDIDVTNHRHYNIMYFNLPKDSIQDNLVMGMVQMGANYLSNPELILGNPLHQDNIFYSKSLSNGRYQIEFYVESNSQIGEYTFHLLVASRNYIESQSLDGKLRIKKSGMDFFGPKFKSIKKLLPPLPHERQQAFNELGWTFVIEDSTNGFNNGYIIIKGNIDQSSYNISFNFKDNAKIGSTIYSGEYDIKINISNPCISQNYSITEVWLFDNVKRTSYFSIYPNIPSFDQILNPFIYYLNDSSINRIELLCGDSQQDLLGAPQLLYFNSSKSIIDVSSVNRELSFTIVTTELKNDQNPIVYITTTDVRILECKSNIIEKLNSNSTYSCTINLPYSFGFNDTLLLSIYGLINNNGIFSGYSTSDLIDLNFISLINTTFDSHETIITGYYRVQGGVVHNLYLYGRYFNGISTAYIIFGDNSTSSIDINLISSTVVMIQNIKATNEPYKVYLKSSSAFTTNTIQVIPIIYDYYINNNPTFPPTLTPVPTNAPQLCKGNPVCGGPSNGKCIENQGCLCYSPWIGLDCLSQIIIVDPPIFNNNSNSSSPTIEIIVPDNNNNNNNSSSTIVTYKSLISIIALREININGNTVKTFTFKDDWLSKEIQHLTYQFYKSIDIQINDNTTITTNITVTLKWFTNETTISFANETLVMNPSSLKYTIEISSYPFESLLNSLELVMSASIESNINSDNICSSREFGETTSGDNSNYLKVQIGNHSLFGRFIRRGIIDSAIRSVNNLQLDKDMNPITKSNNIQTFIGIQIPNYKLSAILDPDFSIVLDSYSASSICSSSKLTTGKIVGIIIGCIGFISIIVISIIYYIKKKYQLKRAILNIENKMKNINNS